MDILIDKIQAVINTLGEIDVKGRANIERMYGSMMVLDKILESLKVLKTAEEKGEK